MTSSLHASDYHCVILNDQDWERLLLVLGTATAAALAGQCVLSYRQVIELTNTINLGNPNFTQMALPEENDPDHGMTGNSNG